MNLNYNVIFQILTITALFLNLVLIYLIIRTNFSNQSNSIDHFTVALEILHSTIDEHLDALNSNIKVLRKRFGKHYSESTEYWNLHNQELLNFSKVIFNKLNRNTRKQLLEWYSVDGLVLHIYNRLKQGIKL